MTIASGLALAMTLGACGGSDTKGGCSANPTGPGCPATPSPTPPPVRTIIKTGSCNDIGVDTLCFFNPFTTTQKGDLDVTVDWTFPEDSIQALVSSGTCTLDQINGNQCSYIATTPASTTPKPRVLTAKGVAAGTYQLYVGNRGPRTESVSVQVGLTTGGTASSDVGTNAGRREDVRPYAGSVAAH
ncbi:MAG: hypothetical protein DMF80_00460 [Acidobacteria bacterium]|nr:MAG: hypothetical protein DMF80_00460 [Acidobacteriota bacterium]PYQ18029.1 MAG: hypothetical protein DMF81_26195 [Acidobacteriota bacterium]